MKTPEHTEELDLVAHRFEWARIRLNLRVVEVVLEAGYENENKGCRRLRAIEDADPQPTPVYPRFAGVLGIDLEELVEELEQQRQQRLERHRQQMPPREFGALLESARESAEMTVEQVAAGTEGVINSERCHRLEAGRARLPSDREIEALAEPLGVDTRALRQAASRERKVYDRHDNSPTFVIRAVPGFYVNSPLPQPASTKQHLEYATNFAVEKGFRVCLVFFDGRSVYIEPNRSQSESFDPPSMSVM